MDLLQRLHSPVDVVTYLEDEERYKRAQAKNEEHHEWIAIIRPFAELERFGVHFPQTVFKGAYVFEGDQCSMVPRIQGGIGFNERIIQGSWCLKGPGVQGGIVFNGAT